MGLKIIPPNNFKVNFKVPNNDPRFWDAVSQEIATEIHKRTLKGRDVDDRRFKPYSDAYKKAKARGWLKGHGARGTTGANRVDLTLSGKMLKALSAGVRHGKDFAQVRLSGNEGFKAWANEENGREFVGLSNKRLSKIFDKINKWIQRKNGIK